jgi:hypothetical protein
MIQLIIDYLWYDAPACSVISKSLIKLLGANQTRDGWNTSVTHLIRDSSSFSDLGSASTSASAFSSSSTRSVGPIFLDFALGSAKLILSNIFERRFTSIEVLLHTTLLTVVERETGFATQQ